MSERPSGITILAIFASINGIVGTIFAFWISPYPSAATVFFLLIPLLHFVVAYGLWVNVRWAWALTLVLNILFLVYSLISLASLSPFNALLLFMYPLIFLPLLIGISSTEPLIVACAVAMVVDVAIIWYLSARARYQIARARQMSR